jgi:hypothetical protein
MEMRSLTHLDLNLFFLASVYGDEDTMVGDVMAKQYGERASQINGDCEDIRALGRIGLIALTC